MTKIPLAVRIDPGLWAAVDKARGDVSRTRFVERALESAVDFEARLPRPAARASDYSAAQIREAEFGREHGSVVSPGVRGPAPKVPGVKTARELALERQRKLNEKRS